MSQSDVLKVIQSSRGIEQQIVCKVMGCSKDTIGEQIRALARKKEITRVPTENRKSWRLYPT
jgi:predicted transcriptional regulator